MTVPWYEPFGIVPLEATAAGRPVVLLTGWFSFPDGEVTAGDVLAVQAVAQALGNAGLAHDVAWSPVFKPAGLSLRDAQPDRYSHLVFTCGLVHGQQIERLHARYPNCVRIAVGVTVIDYNDPACAGFDIILPRDAPGRPPERDLSAVMLAARERGGAPGEDPRSIRDSPPVVGVFLTSGQGEYGDRRRHEQVNRQLASWLAGKLCAPLRLETRLDTLAWWQCSTPDSLTALIARLDLVVTTRLHGLVLAICQGIPALAVDPVADGGKVTDQAAAWHWPAVLSADQVGSPARLNYWWDWCLSPAGLAAAGEISRSGLSAGASPLLTALVAVLTTRKGEGPPPDGAGR